MKKLMYLFVAVGISLTACQSEEQFVTDPIPVAKNGNTVGESHNTLLTSYYNNLSDAIEGNIGENGLNHAMRGMLLDVLGGVVTGQNNHTMKSGALNGYDEFKSAASFADAMIGIDDHINFYTKPQPVTIFLNNFWSGISNISNVQQCHVYCAQQKSIANNNFTEVNLLMTLGAVDVFEDSYVYWDSNFSTWYLLLNPNGSVPQGMIGDVSKADAYGYVYGVLYANYYGYGPLACEASGLAFSIAYSIAAATK